MTWISFGFGFAVVDSLFPSASKHSWNDWDKIKKILPPSSQNCVEDLWIKGGFQNIIAEGFQHIVKGQHVLRSHQVVHFSLCCWWGLQSVTFIHLIHQNTNAQRRRNTETRQGRWASANCRLVRAAAGYQIQSHTQSSVHMITDFTDVSFSWNSNTQWTVQNNLHLRYQKSYFYCAWVWGGGMNMKTFVQKARKDPDCFDESHSKLADTAVFQLLKIPSELEVAPVKLLTLRLFTLHTRA